ncbi:MAG: monovalent cation/H(+) antiporter subunit G [Actinobacteria bacterium]|nr:monovalent cation/H(+) antiporter subunit G [Actinomycetota bacterium]MBU1942398.1 monovalent cation/H(+) antiporter subunit G [Actinomycetota bacterium]MBU2686270.1 monovalent cation/H(+) antiporter subunit G [Actinomycetota bacterium]
MVGAVRNTLSVIFGLIGLYFFVVGTTGLLRCPDLYSRLHPSTKCDTLGACSVTLALMIQTGFTMVTLKLLAIVFFVLLSSAVCGHAIGRSAFRTRVVPWHKAGVRPWPLEDE